MKTIDKIEAIVNKINEFTELIENSQSVDDVKGYIAEVEKLQNEKNDLEAGEVKKMSKVENYLDTKQAVADFVSAFENAKSTTEAHNAWKSKLQENGITITDKDNVLPKAIELEIQTILTRSNPVFPLFQVTNVGGMLVARDFTSADEAKVHVPGTTKDKQSANLKVSAIKPKMVYKRQSFDEIDKRTFQNFADIYELTIQELTQRIIDKIVDLALVEGKATDGETGSSETENGFVSILNETDTNKVKHVDASKDLVAAIEDAVDLIEVPGKKALVVTLTQKRAILNALRAKFPNTVYRNNNKELAEEFGVDELIVYRGTKNIKPTIIAEGAYAVDMQPLTRIEQFKIDTNENEILVETPATGRPVKFGGIVVIDLAG